jgi:hypothetical protein
MNYYTDGTFVVSIHQRIFLESLDILVDYNSADIDRSVFIQASILDNFVLFSLRNCIILTLDT